MAHKYKRTAIQYAQDCIDGKLIVGNEVVMAARRFLDDLERDDLELREKEPDFVIGVIERLMVHKQGETVDGKPLTNTPLILQPWQIFIIYNVIGFYCSGTSERRYKEVFIFVPRKSGKTLFIAGLSFALALLERKSGARIYIVAASQKQACQSFDDILYTLRYRGMINDFRVRDNNAEHSVHFDFIGADGLPDGSIDIEALASNPDSQDSFNCNIAIADEMHAFRKPAQYNRFKEAMKAYTNKLMIGITTAGDNINSFCYGRLEYGVKVVSGQIKDDSLFAFISRADVGEDGEVDFLNPVQHQKANPSYGITIRPADIMAEARQAEHDPQQRKDFLSRSLNVYTTALRAYFDIEKFRSSDGIYTWTLDELSKMPIDWYGGADLSKINDLTAAALYGQYGDVDICITHAFFPVTQAAAKQDEDNIPLYQWLDEGWLSLCNAPVILIQDIVNWFIAMRDRGFKIRQIGHDRKFAGEEYFPLMKKAHFSIIDQPQLYYLKSQGFKHIEKAALNRKLYYLHSGAYEYCVSNVRAQEGTDDAVMYEKVEPKSRIDLFDASVFACIRMIKNQERKKKAAQWFGDNEK